MQMRDIGLLGLGVVAGVAVGAYVLPKMGVKFQTERLPSYERSPIPAARQAEIEEEAKRRLVTID